jgi:hypothetical protein
MKRTNSKKIKLIKIMEEVEFTKVTRSKVHERKKIKETVWWSYLSSPPRYRGTKQSQALAAATTGDARKAHQKDLQRQIG